MTPVVSRGTGLFCFQLHLTAGELFRAEVPGHKNLREAGVLGGGEAQSQVLIVLCIQEHPSSFVAVLSAFTKLTGWLFLLLPGKLFPQSCQAL